MKEQILKEFINQLKPKVFCGGNRCSGFHNLECDDSKHPDGRELVDIRKVIKVMSDFEQRIRKDEFKKTLKEHDKNLISEVKRTREETIDEIKRKNFTRSELVRINNSLKEEEVRKIREETIREVKTCLPAPAFLNGLGKASYNEVETEAFENGVYQTYVRIKKYLDTLNKLKK